jgi:hypothetical protein
LTIKSHLDRPLSEISAILRCFGAALVDWEQGIIPREQGISGEEQGIVGIDQRSG